MCNFFSSVAYLASVHGRDVEVRDFQIGEHVLRLPVVDGRPRTTGPFLDYHRPITTSGKVHRAGTWFAPCVAVDVVRVDGSPPVTEHQVAPFIQLDEFADMADYVEKWLSDGRVKDHERRRRQAERDLGPLTFTVNDPRGIEEAFAWKRAQYPDNPELTDANLELMLGMRELLLVSTLRAGDRLLAAWVGFQHERTWSGWIFAYDPDEKLAKYSLGWQLLYRLIGEAFTQRCREFDFSIGGEGYKWFFATHARICAPIGRPPLKVRLLRLARTWRGWLRGS